MADGAGLGPMPVPPVLPLGPPVVPPVLAAQGSGSLVPSAHTVTRETTKSKFDKQPALLGHSAVVETNNAALITSTPVPEAVPE